MCKQKKVCVIGLGYVGLPTATIIASKEFKVNGYDFNSEIVDIINRGDIHIVEPYLKGLVEYVVKNNYLKAYSQPLTSDIYIIAVPTPIDVQKIPDIFYVEKAIDSIIPILKEGDLIL
ncbi:MAG: hypothetical protein NC917_04540 [Candidatus Omnitrophica bacterium]|nr:hypothetical protein [Candidatus Omnitrophota bacterium]